MDGQTPEDRPPLRFFRSPNATASPDVHRVWLDCCLPEIAEMNDILWKLDTWARLNCQIEMRMHHHLGYELPYLFWLSPSGVRHECFADTYSHWFLCGCIEVKAPQICAPPSEEEETLLEQLNTEESEKLDQRLEEIRIHSLETVTVSLDDIAQFDLELFLSTGTTTQGAPNNCPTPRPFHTQTILFADQMPEPNTPQCDDLPCS